MVERVPFRAAERGNAQVRQSSLDLPKVDPSEREVVQEVPCALSVRSERREIDPRRTAHDAAPQRLQLAYELPARGIVRRAARAACLPGHRYECATRS